MFNNGFDLALSYGDQKGDFGYSISANISQYKNEIIQLDEFNTQTSDRLIIIAKK